MTAHRGRVGGTPRMDIIAILMLIFLTYATSFVVDVRIQPTISAIVSNRGNMMGLLCAVEIGGDNLTSSAGVHVVVKATGRDKNFATVSLQPTRNCKVYLITMELRLFCP